MSLRTSLGLSYLGVVVFCMGIIAILAWPAVENLYIEAQKANLLAQAQLAASALTTESIPGVDSRIYSQTSNVQPGIHTRILDSQGAVIIDLDTQKPLSPSIGLNLPQLAQNATGQVQPEELLSRPEVSEALKGHASTVVRRVAVAGGRPVVYAAAPVISADGSVVRIVYLASPLPDTQWTALPEIVKWQFIGVILAGILIAGGAGWMLSRRLSRPLSLLVEASHEVAAGKLDRVIPEDSSIADVAIVSQAFNAMTASLKQSTQAKNAFVADVSHELRTPLTVIKGTIETLEDGAMDDVEARGQFLEAMNDETDRLIRLVNDLLVLTRADADALNLRRQNMDLEELARSRCTRMEQATKSAHIHWSIEKRGIQNDHCIVFADPDRIAQVIDNLLNNAARYSPRGGSIRILIECDNGFGVCRVMDSGPGIPKEHLSEIFERFYRVEPARDRSQGGSGLGLAIVKGLVMAHGGRVSAESEVGKGTTVSFWLPLASSKY